MLAGEAADEYGMDRNADVREDDPLLVAIAPTG